MNWFIKTIRALSPDCKSAVRWQSEALDRKLPLFARIGLRLHLRLCVWCSRYGRQIKFLRAAARHGRHETEPGQALTAEARERIKRALDAGRRQ